MKYNNKVIMIQSKIEVSIWSFGTLYCGNGNTMVGILWYTNNRQYTLADVLFTFAGKNALFGWGGSGADCCKLDGHIAWLSK